MSEKPFIVDGNNTTTKGDLIKGHWCCLIFLYSFRHKCTKKKKLISTLQYQNLIFVMRRKSVSVIETWKGLQFVEASNTITHDRYWYF